MNEKSIKTIKIITRKDYLVMIGILLICAGLFNWMVSGTVRTTEKSVGVITTYDDSFEIHFPGDGVVTDMCVGRNYFVNKGDLIARVFRLDNYDVDYDLASENVVADMLANAIDIKSSVSGYVSYVDKNEWDSVTFEEPIIHVCQTKENMPVGSYILARADESYVHKITEGETRANVVSYNHNVDVYGQLTGTVVEKYQYPMNSQAVNEKVGSKDATDYMFKNTDQKDIYAVLIKVDLDKNGEPAFSIRQPETINLNEQCDVTFILSEKHPYENIFKLKGGDE